MPSSPKRCPGQGFAPSVVNARMAHTRPRIFANDGARQMRMVSFVRAHRRSRCMCRKELVMTLGRRTTAEFLGTFWLVLGGCGSAVLAAAVPDVGIGYLGVALAFGLTVLTMVYAVGYVSGGHFNPAVTVGLFAAKRFSASDVLPYVVAQVTGAIAGAGVLWVIASGKAGFDASASGFAANGFGAHSPGGYSMVAALVCEVAMTFFFVTIILGATDKRAPQGFAGLAIGLALTLIHLISIPVTNT